MANEGEQSAVYRIVWSTSVYMPHVDDTATHPADYPGAYTVPEGRSETHADFIAITDCSTSMGGTASTKDATGRSRLAQLAAEANRQEQQERQWDRLLAWGVQWLRYLCKPR